MKGQQILNFKIIREIGTGGMATVYEAIHTKLDTKVAIKVLNPVLAANKGIRQRFMQEAKIMASLNHDSITKVIDFDEEENRLAIVMEYLDGQTLDEHIKQKGALNEKEAKKIFIPVLKAFSYAHNKGIVHRDVKPSNIFITSEGKVKIMDFGIAKIVEEGALVLTQTGTQMGTPVYMSPEQVHDSKNIDHRTDIYSLGVMLWFLLDGNPPYDTTKNSSFDIFMKINSEPLPKLASYSDLDLILQKATKKEMDNRYKNCEEFISAFSLLSKVNHLSNQKENTDIVYKESLSQRNNIESKKTIKIKDKKSKVKKTVDTKDSLLSDEKWIKKYQITFNNGQFMFKNFRYDRLIDAINYAKLVESKSIGGKLEINETPVNLRNEVDNNPNKNEKTRIEDLNDVKNSPLSDEKHMKKYQITFSNGKFLFKEFRYTHLKDAINYAKLLESKSKENN